MLKPAPQNNNKMTAAAFAEYNKSIFYDEKIQEDIYEPIVNKEAHYITTAELTNVIQNKFKANKSSGLSKMPLQLVKNLGP